MLRKLITHFCPHNKEEEFASLTEEAIRCYEAAEGKGLEKALFWIKKGDAVMKQRDKTK